MIFGVALRFVALGRESLWIDELFSVFWSKSGLAYIVHHAAAETNPPLYYILLDLWMSLFDTSESAVRLLSACASAATIAVVFALGCAAFDRRAGAVAALLFALSPLHLYFAQETRPYALVGLATATLLLSAFAVLARLGKRARPMRTAASLPGIALVVSAVASIYLHYIGLLIVATLGIALALSWWWRFAFARSVFICLASLGTAIALIAAPVLVLAIRHSLSANIEWIMFPWPRELLHLMAGTPDWATGRIEKFSLAAAAIWAGLFVYGAWKHRRETAFALIYVLPIIGFTLLVLVSLARPILLMRTALWLSIPVYVGLGGAIAAIRLGKAARIATAVAVLSSAAFTAGYFAFPSREQWREQVPIYAALVSPNDLLVLGRNTPAIAFVYYDGRCALPVLRRWPAAVTAPDILDADVTGIRTITDGDIRDAMRSGKKVWYVARECAAPPAVPPANILLRSCTPPPDGWSRIAARIRSLLARIRV